MLTCFYNGNFRSARVASACAPARGPQISAKAPRAVREPPGDHGGTHVRPAPSEPTMDAEQVFEIGPFMAAADGEISGAHRCRAAPPRAS